MLSRNSPNFKYQLWIISGDREFGNGKKKNCATQLHIKNNVINIPSKDYFTFNQRQKITNPLK